MSATRQSTVSRPNISARLIGLARFAAREFGPLIVFLGVSAALGVKPAIALSILTVVAESVWRWRRGENFTRLYLLVSGLTLLFGAVDLYAASPFMLKYESVITNIATGAAFVFGAFGDKPMLQEFAEQRAATPFPITAEVRRFFQLFTLAWAVYFLAKAALYAWLGWILPLTEAVALRSLIGGVSLALLIGLSVTQGRRLFFLCRSLGLLPRADGVGAPPNLEKTSA
jgi:intracellular septation protein A